MSFANTMALESTGAATGGSGMLIILVYVAIFAVLYFIMLRPQRKEQKQKAQLLAQLAVGDSVRTTGGFIGTVIDIDDESSTVIVEFGNNKNCRIPMVKEAIVEVEKPEDAVKDNTKEEKSK
ncbi:preprotein translocase subunit YajC [Butyrivibrio sp. VCD2006]|uniref:preprotein translocase subunit YajC n=1 Tax=Butyrivibrio sp. VCD2006 TaxID=1280664 RepID=UPI000402BDC4|nr:preprotein translocase subunit YajC [Butyrivibrio sp. VCD2006]